MLFVSRYIGTDKYGVVDTDDGVEEVVTLNDIEHAVLQQGLEINGAVIHRDFPQRDGGKGHKWLDYAKPFQDDSSKTSFQEYVKREQSVEVNVYNSTITCIHAANRRIRRPVSIRLSDFAPAIGDCVLSPNATVGRHILTLVFDDKLKSLTELSFRMAKYSEASERYGVESHGVVFDMRELSSNELAFKVYSQLAEYPRNPFGSVRDKDTRLAKAYNLFGVS